MTATVEAELVTDESDQGGKGGPAAIVSDNLFKTYNTTEETNRNARYNSHKFSSVTPDFFSPYPNFNGVR